MSLAIPTPSAALLRPCFYLLLPGFFLYHTLVGIGVLPGLLGGYSSAMASLLLLPLLLAYIAHLMRDTRHRTAIDITFNIFVFYYALVLLVQLATNARGQAANEQVGIIAQFLTLYVLALLAPLGELRFQRWLLFFFLLMSGIIIFNADEGTFVIAALELDKSSGDVANYQAFAFVYSVVMLYVLAPLQRRWQRLPIYLIGVPTLFLNGARTEFIGMILLILLIEFMESRHKLLTLLVSAAIVGAAAAAIPMLADLYPESRTVLLFIDYSDDVSANERSRMLSEGIDSIVENPFLGSFGSYKTGEHIHNGLSAWVDLGFIGFSLYLSLLLLPTLHLFVLDRPQLDSPSYRLAFGLIFMSALFAVTAKHFTHQLLPLAMGLYARHLVEARLRHSSDSMQKSEQ